MSFYMECLYIHIYIYIYNYIYIILYMFQDQLVLIITQVSALSLTSQISINTVSNKVFCVVVKVLGNLYW